MNLSLPLSTPIANCGYRSRWAPLCPALLNTPPPIFLLPVPGRSVEPNKKMHIIPAVEQRVLNASSQRKRPTEIDERKMLRQVEAADWTMVLDIADYKYIAKKLQFTKKRNMSSLGGWIRGFRGNEGAARGEKKERNNLKNVLFSFFYKLMRKRVIEDLEDYNR